MMTASLLLSLLLGSAIAACTGTDHRCQWEEWKVLYGRHYTESEEERRFEIFKANAANVLRLSAEQPTAQFSLNQFGDLSQDEFLESFTHRRPPVPGVVGSQAPSLRAVRSLPANFTSPWVTTARNQLSCGACWAFASMAVTESAWLRSTNTTEVFAPQQLIDCDTSATGCSGGGSETALDYLVSFTQSGGGAIREADYPYVQAQQTCSATAGKGVGKLAMWWMTNWGDESETDQVPQTLYQVGPMAVSLDARTLQLYTSGILQDTAGCHITVNHEVTLVGWGETAGSKYWVIKNSWGPTWGEAGLFRLARTESSTGNGTCLIRTYTANTALATGEAYNGSFSTACAGRECGTADSTSGISGFMTVDLCGTCSVGSTCNSTGSCATTWDKPWTQFIPAGTGALSVSTSANSTTITSSTNSSTRVFIKWAGSSAWANLNWVSFGAQFTVGAGGVVGVGMLNGPSATTDGVWWKVLYAPSAGASTVAKISLCSMSSGTSTCQWFKSVLLPLNTPTMITANFIKNSGVVGARLYVGDSVVVPSSTQYVSVASSTYLSSAGDGFIVLSGLNKTAADPAFVTRTRFTFSTNASFMINQMKSYMSLLLALPSSSLVSLVGTGLYSTLDYAATWACTLQDASTAVLEVSAGGTMPLHFWSADLYSRFQQVCSGSLGHYWIGSFACSSWATTQQDIGGSSYGAFSPDTADDPSADAAGCSSLTLAQCTGDCSWCSNADACLDTGISCPACTSRDYSACNSSGCVPCNTARTCISRSAPASSCPACSGLNETQCDAASSLCDWCTASLACADEGKCPSCSDISYSSCTSSACTKCSSSLSCAEKSDGCSPCYGVNTSADCGNSTLASKCDWCSGSGMCLPQGKCSSCTAYANQLSCSGVNTCTWCLSRLECGLDSAYCVSCNNATSTTECRSLPGCIWNVNSYKCTTGAGHSLHLTLAVIIICSLMRISI